LRESPVVPRAPRWRRGVAQTDRSCWLSARAYEKRPRASSGHPERASIIRAMHLLVPFASDDSEACRHVLRDLALPNLSRLLARLEPAARDEGPADSFSPPHERALAAARGWRGEDGAHAWGLVTPAHWLLGRDHATMLAPAALGLGEPESRALFDAIRGLFESEGFIAAWGAPDRWYVGHDELEGFATASLDRVIGRNVDRWLGETRSPVGRRIRRL